MSDDIQLLSSPDPLVELSEEDIKRQRAAYLGIQLEDELSELPEAPF